MITEDSSGCLKKYISQFRCIKSEFCGGGLEICVLTSTPTPQVILIDTKACELVIVIILCNFKLFTSFCTHPKLVKRFLFWPLTFRATTLISFLESLPRINLVTTCYSIRQTQEKEERQRESKEKKGRDGRGRGRKGREGIDSSQEVEIKNIVKCFSIPFLDMKNIKIILSVGCKIGFLMLLR